MIILISYFQLLIISFLAATILPLSSELVLSTMLLTDSFDKYLLLVVASFGNIFGSSVNWYLGKKILIFKDKKWFPVNEKQIAKSEMYFKKYGIWSLLLAWEGALLIEALARSNDQQLAGAIIFLLTASIVFLNFITDILLSLLDPRIRKSIME